MINEKIKNIRKKLDLLDNHFLKLIKKRSSLVNQVLAQKKYKKEIIDRKRIKVILKKIRFKSINMGVDHKVTNRIWKSMIQAFIDYEFRKFKKK